MKTIDQEIFDQIRQVAKLMRVQQVSIKPRELVLIVMHQYEEGIMQKEIAKLICTSPSTLSEMINKLVSDNLIERRENPDDRRAYQLFLTEEGRKRALEIEDIQVHAIKDVFRNLTDEDKEALSKLLSKTINN